MDIQEIIKFILPSLVVFATAYLTIWQFLKGEHKKKQLEINLANKDIVTPIRLQAYERIILLLERISPTSLIARTLQPGMLAYHLQSILINSIREEFEHNLSQQLYISSTAWEMVKSAKEEIVNLINTAANKLSENELASGEDLSRKIFEMTIQMEKLPIATALEKLKSEIRQIF